MNPQEAVTLRQALQEEDVAAIRRLVDATGFFTAEELDIAEELPRERLTRGAASGYEFLLAGEPLELLGYSCYGHIAGTRSSWDLYWIAVDPAAQGQGLGRRLLRETETRIHTAGGTAVYVETSSRDQYAATRTFYEHNGYRLVARLADFYAPGDAKCIYRRDLA